MMKTEREKYFYQNLIIDDEDRKRAAKALKAKGIEKHIMIKEKLLAWNESENIAYSKIASTYRYDKRIRNVLFKYISYLEEFYRAVILDNYAYDLNQIFWTKTLLKNLKKYKDLSESLEHLGFYYLIEQCLALPDIIKNSFLFNSKHLKSNLLALNTLRNAVMHNKFLLLYRGYEKCYVNGVDNGKSSNLKANILNLIQFLPTEVGDQCKIDINACKDNRNKNSDTLWDLPSQIAITL